MSNEKTTIHEFDLNIIYEYFSDMERQGPGSAEVTLKALSFIGNLTEQSKIADIGCGTGGQTIVLAQNTNCKITGVELWPDFVDQFNRNARNAKLRDNVRGIAGDMQNLPFQEEELDLIWSEGAIYNIGFERGLKEWHKFLKTGGYIAVTENTWFTDDRPDEIQQFWHEAYPQIDTIPHKIAQMQKAGYLPVAVFVVPESCWFDFYRAQVPIQEKFLKKYPGNITAETFIGYQQHEASLYDKYKEFYGYVFYIGKKM